MPYAAENVSFSAMARRLQRGDDLRQDADTLHIRLLRMDSLLIDGTWNAHEVFSSYWRLYMNDRDGPAVDWAGGRYRLKRGRLHFMPAWVRFNCWLDRPVKHFYVHFDLFGVAEPAMRAMFDRPLTLRPDRDLERHAQQLAHALETVGEADAPPTLLKGNALIYGALAALMSQLSPAATEVVRRSASDVKAIAPALGYIDSRLGESMDNFTLAERCALSEDHFIKVFRSVIGQTPGQFVLQRRIAAAAQSLLFTDQTIEQIAAATGFANRFHFSRAFSRRMGVGPATYRQRPHA
jgi:AraC-like DNA-binding protein